MPFAISADFRLGYYQGRNAEGVPERYPTPLRLHAALTAAAYGQTETEDLPAPVAQALRWLEENPPDAVVLPQSQPSWERNPRNAYREKSLIKADKRSTNPSKKNPELASRLSALNGPVQWWWTAAPDPETAETLDELCFETPYLGEVSSPVRLNTTTEDTLPDHAMPRLDGLPVGKGDRPTFEVPVPGRLEDLQGHHSALHPAKTPTEKSDQPGSNESENLAAYTREHIARVTYDAPSLNKIAVPWDAGYLLPVVSKRNDGVSPWQPRGRDFVAWCVAVHRALVKRIGFGAPPLVTGKYSSVRLGESTDRSPSDQNQPHLLPMPANRLAIQVIPPGLPLQSEWAEAMPNGGFLLMVPSDAADNDPESVAQVADATQHVKEIYQRHLGSVRLGAPVAVDLREFWTPPAPGFQRTWEPTPVMVAESRIRRRKDGSRPWTATDALALALGYVWRDRAAESLRGDISYDALAQGVLDGALGENVRVENARRVHPHSMADYVHKIHKDNLATALTASFTLDGLLPSTAAAAIGQSRHLGGGMLYPVDRPSYLADGLYSRETSNVHQGGERA
ncbi:type I-G CRISPR-associated protein Csb2 [Haematomicrobium sanguinis]|uniref:type I-G CRISPR-associated protein Csb2 n=1 Tax=Haematomicrobium sanguinis TaxID=479106 RepID=UPI00047DAF69|nr:type I-U CRISPR-associated protein Csb2 [Haematomicrobium sanguinis]